MSSWGDAKGGDMVRTVTLGEGESIWLAPGIRLAVVRVGRFRARLGVEAGPGVPIWRGELRRDGLPSGARNGGAPRG